jgi:hypothetical protein
MSSKTAGLPEQGGTATTVRSIAPRAPVEPALSGSLAQGQVWPSAARAAAR